jgi:uncharacterized glyoxalase superfamily protein PhnB
MTAEERWRAPGVMPILAYVDVPAAVDWLTRAFGFIERADARLTWEGGCRAWMEIGEGLVCLSTSGGHGVISPAVSESTSQSTKIYVADIDAHFTRSQSAGATIVSELQDGFWGGRVYRAKDLEGHIWEFSQRGRDLAAQDWQLPPGMRRGA